MMRVLVTRPTAQAAAMIELMTDSGFEVVHQPCLAITPVDPSSVDGLQSKRLAMELYTFDHVIVISTNAAHHWLDLAQDYWPQWPVGVQWWAMGHSTQVQLQAYAVDAQRPKLGDTSEDLLVDLMPQIQPHHKVLIVRGVGGRETLAQTLRYKGVTVEYAQCYGRQTPVINAQTLLHLERFSPQTVVLQSGDTLANFDHLLGGQNWCDPQQTLLLVPSQRVAQQAHELGYQQLLVSEGASNQAMCDTLLQRVRALNVE
ncbi:MAG TPA: uroporphyrinogen-III synthase [Oceanospirillaceae bacterium]|nr:uroporphyrinogen-III synthase [Oceanospirillaceae bacterium]